MGEHVLRKGSADHVYAVTPGFCHGQPARLFSLAEVRDPVGVLPALRSFGPLSGELAGFNAEVALYRVRRYSGRASWSSWYRVSRASGEERPAKDSLGRLSRPKLELPAEMLEPSA